jgi:S-layer homology domain/Trypsin
MLFFRLKTTVFLSACLVMSCAVSATPDGSATEVTSEANPSTLLSNEQTVARPEVGYIYGGTTRLCTATLVTESTMPGRASRFVLTASHCTGFRSGAEPAVSASLRFVTNGKEYSVVRMRSFLSTANVSNRILSDRLRDVTILELDSEVPLSEATPVVVGKTRPARNETVSLFGFGCTDRCEKGSENSPKIKRVAQVVYGLASFKLCPGDSGGPSIDARNQLVRINSAVASLSQNDVYADVVGMSGEIEAQMAAFRSNPYVPSPKLAAAELKTCEACVGSAAFWCRGKNVCLAFKALAEVTCKGGELVNYAADCNGIEPSRTEDIVGAHCTAATDCKSCQSRYNCMWTASGCYDASAGIPKGARPLLNWSSPVCCSDAPRCNNNGACERTRGETVDNCSADCKTRPSCNNDGVCDAAAGETQAECLTDCTQAVTCNNNQVCEPHLGEWCGVCADCFCSTAPVCNANGTCEANLGETTATCSADCKVAAAASRFSDMNGHPAKFEVDSLAESKIISGDAAGTFRPDATITRAEFAAIVANAWFAATSPSPRTFTDVPEGAWYASAVKRCVAAGAMSGFPDGTFRPLENVSRQQALVVMDNVRKLSGGQFSQVEARFGDAAAVASWAKEGVADAQHNEILTNEELLKRASGIPLLLRPTVAATRAEVASFVFYARSALAP